MYLYAAIAQHHNTVLRGIGTRQLAPRMPRETLAKRDTMNITARSRGKKDTRETLWQVTTETRPERFDETLEILKQDK